MQENTPIIREDPQCTSCLAYRSEIGGEFHVWKARNPGGRDTIYCDVCHANLRAVAAKEEAILRAIAPGIARIRKHWNLSVEDIFDILAELRTIDADVLEAMLAGDSEEVVERIPATASGPSPQLGAGPS